jgi:hypothetical protein
MTATSKDDKEACGCSSADAKTRTGFEGGKDIEETDLEQLAKIRG